MRDDAMREIEQFPSNEAWHGVSERERGRRARILWGVTMRVMKDGPHKAHEDAERGRLFAPFDALQGYDELIEEVERKANSS